MINRNAVTHVGRRYKFRGETYVVVHVGEKKVSLQNESRPELRKAIRWTSFAALQNKGRLLEENNTDDFIEWMRHARPLTDEAQKSFDRKLEYMRAILGELKGDLPRKAVQNITDRVAARIGDQKPPSYGAIFQWLQKMKNSGMEYMSLAGDVQARPNAGNAIDPRVRSILDQTLADFFESPTGLSINDCYEDVTEQIRVHNERNPTDCLKAPSRATVYRYVKTLDGYKIAEAQHGRQQALKLFKAGRSFEECSSPLQRVEIDSNYMDIILVADDRTIIGRPYLTAMIDCFSRCLIGWVISFAAPSEDKTLQVLKHAITLDPNKEFGGIPVIIVGDNGAEFKGSAYARACQRLGIDVGFSRTKKGDNKPHIERFFRTMSMQLIHLLPGTTFSNHTARHDYDSIKEASLTIGQLRDIFEQWLTDVYHNNLHRKLQRSPREKWHSYPYKNEIIRKSKPLVDAICRVSTFCTINNGRVTFKGLSYYSPALAAIDNRMSKTDRKVEVLYDPSDLADVYIVNPFDKSSLPVAMAADANYQNGLTMLEHEQISKDMREANLVGAAARRGIRVAFYRRLFELTGKLSKKAKAYLAEMKKPSFLEGVTKTLFPADPVSSPNTPTQPATPATGSESNAAEPIRGFPAMTLTNHRKGNTE